MKYFQQYTMINKILTVTEEQGSITGIWIGTAGEKNPEKGLGGEWNRQETPLIKKAAAQLTEYFAGNRQTFDFPIAPSGTEFQKRVWQALREIPYGETASYGEIAEKAGCPKGARAVGMACNRNPILIVIPCHRVIGANGSLTGFGGGLDVKERLLGLENRSKK